ncbi:hypothetical protein D3C85_1007630 [compost metagenome]
MIKGTQHITLTRGMNIPGSPYTTHSGIYRKYRIIRSQFIDFESNRFRMNGIYFPFIFDISMQVLFYFFINFQLCIQKTFILIGIQQRN